jgi:hypothetical protein
MLAGGEQDGLVFSKQAIQVRIGHESSRMVFSVERDGNGFYRASLSIYE